MFVTVIVPTYKDTEALALILDALELQTHREFELIVAEDDNSSETAQLLKDSSRFYTIKHHTQEDRGWRKTTALNGAIAMSKGEYIIFFDGDCLPYSTFVESHVVLAKKRQFLCGRRVNLGTDVSRQLRDRVLSVSEIEQRFFRYIVELKKDRARHVEQGFYLNPKILAPIVGLLDRRPRLVGCNFSLYKDDILKINGFDESYLSGDIADDVDLEWRLNSIGIKGSSCRYAANLLHLHHDRSDRRDAHRRNYEAMCKKREKGEYFCLDGINKEP